MTSRACRSSGGAGDFLAAVLVALALTGALSARLGGGNVRRAVLRVVVGAARAQAFTYGVGHLFGTTVH